MIKKFVAYNLECDNCGIKCLSNDDALSVNGLYESAVNYGWLLFHIDGKDMGYCPNCWTYDETAIFIKEKK